MGRNHLAHASGDTINAVLAAAGYNFRRLPAWLRFLLLRILIALSLQIRLKSGSSPPTIYSCPKSPPEMGKVHPHLGSSRKIRPF
jgi:hypothetical protein